VSIMWLGEMVGSDDRPAVARAMAAAAIDDAVAERADGERLAKIEDEREAKLAALRVLGVGAGQVSMLGLQLQEAAARADDLRDQLQRAEVVRDQLHADWQRLSTTLENASALATRSSALTLDGEDLLTREHLLAETRRQDAPLTAARARTANARVRQLDRHTVS
jgi:hypothetical protein